MRKAGVDFLEVLAFADGLWQSGDLSLLELQDPELLAVAKVAGQLGDRALLQIEFLQVGNRKQVAGERCEGDVAGQGQALESGQLADGVRNRLDEVVVEVEMLQVLEGGDAAGDGGQFVRV